MLCFVMNAVFILYNKVCIDVLIEVSPILVISLKVALY